MDGHSDRETLSNAAEIEPIATRGPRRIYLLPVAMLTLPIWFFGKLISADRSLNVDAGLIALVTIFLIAVTPVVLRFIRPPELRANAQGLVLQIGLGTRRWNWDRIERFRLLDDRTKTGHGNFRLAFDWCATPGAMRQTEWLNYSLGRDAQDLIVPLDANLAAARAAGTAVPVANPDSDRLADDRGARRSRHMGWIGGLLGCLFIGWIIALNMTHTILLTPIDPRFQLAGEIAGGCIGLLLPLSFLRLTGSSKSGPLPIGGKIIFGVFLCLQGVGIFAGLGGWAAWRVSEAVTFSGSHAPFVPHAYRILSWHSDRGYTARIDPYNSGDNSSVPISKSDYDYLRMTSRSYYSGKICYPALEQKQGTAVRMREPEQPSRWGAKRVVIPCPGVV